MKNKKGFTLIELLAVIVILGTLITLATVGVIKVMNDNKEKVGKFTLSQIEDASNTYALDHDYCESSCVFKGQGPIVDALDDYFAEIETKCNFSDNATLTIKWENNAASVTTAGIECTE